MASIAYTGFDTIDIYYEDGSVLNTWTDMYLIPSSKLYVNVFSPIITITDVPKTIRYSDSTTYLSGNINYSATNGAFEFLREISNPEDVNRIEKYLYDNLHAKKVYLVLSTMPDRKFEGWISIGSIENGSLLKVTINYVLYP